MIKVKTSKHEIKCQYGTSGILFGFVYFVICPLLLKLLYGVIPAFDLDIPDFDHISFVFALFVFSAFIVVILSNFLAKNFLRPVYFDGSVLKIYLVMCWLGVLWIYIVHASNTGANHWSEGSAGTLGTGGNVFFLLLLNATNILLLASPFVYIASDIKAKSFFRLSSITIINLVAMLITGNRIFALGLLIMYFITLGKLWRTILFLTSPLILFISHLYAIVRSTVSLSMSFDSAFEALFTAVQYRLDTFSAIDLVSPLFESANIVILSYVINEKSIPDIGFLETIIFRPIRGLFGLTEGGNINSISLYVGKSLGLDGVALNATLLGESWLNGGFAVWIVIVTFVFVSDVIASSLYFLPVSRVVLFSAAFYAWRFEFMYYVITFSFVLLFEISRFLKKLLLRKSNYSYRLVSEVK